MDSSSGKAKVTPMPRKNVRRGNDILVMNMAASSFSIVRRKRLVADLSPKPLSLSPDLSLRSLDRGIFNIRRHLDPLLEWQTVDNAEHDRCKAIIRRRIPHDRADRGHVVVREPSPQCVRHQLF